MRYIKGAHILFRTEYHLVWIPRYRRRIFVNGLDKYAKDILTHLEGLDEDIEVIKVNVRIDHVHMIIVIPLRIAVADVVQFIKSQSAKKLKTKFPFFNHIYINL